MAGLAPGGSMWGDELKEYLDRQGVKCTVIPHPAAYTAQEVAARAHVSGREIAKSVIVKIDGKLAMMVLPASEKLIFHLLKEATGARSVGLANELDFIDVFPGCERGAMPPFGNLYGLPVYVADSLAEDEEIAFNAGSFTELVRMAYRDFERLARPIQLSVSARV